MQITKNEAPLFPEYPFKEYILAGETPIIAGKDYDWWIDRPHGMDGWIINLTIEGTGQVWKDERRFLLQQGDILLIPESASHFYGRYENSPLWKHQWVFFHPPKHWERLLKFRQNINGVFKTSIVSGHAFRKIQSLFEDIIHLSYSLNKNELDEEISMNILEGILLRCAKIDVLENSSIAPKQTDEKMIEIAQWLSVNYTKPLTVDIISKAMNISAHKLTTQFKEHMGMPLMRWINLKQLEFAAKLLRVSSSSVKDIAKQAGFTDNLYFSRLFKKSYKQSPREYRKKNSSIDSSNPK